MPWELTSDVSFHCLANVVLTGGWKVSDAHAIGDRKWQLSTILKGEAR